MVQLQIKSITVHSNSEVIRKLTHETLSLFHIEVGEGEGDWEVFIETFENPVCVKTTLILDGEKLFMEGFGFSDEKPSGAAHRLYKGHLYEMLMKKFAFPAAPWGILHGVRPTKIARRYFAAGLTDTEIFKRFTEDYFMSAEKANLLLEVAEREKKFLDDCDDKKISVYIGIPFCMSKCFYCSFPSYVLPSEKKLQTFMEIFKRDLYAAKTLTEKLGYMVESLYIGGGTPTALPDDYFADMMDWATEAFVTPNLREFTLEAGRPDSMSDGKYEKILNSPVTRVSVNPQTMQERTLKRIGRLHTPQSIVEMYNAFRNKKSLEINMDLILGLLGENAEDVKDTAEKIVNLAPDNITLHALAKKRGSPLKTAIDENEKIILPGDEEVVKMSKIAHSLIRNAGYFPYYLYRQGYMSGGLENIGFSKIGKESLYNVKIIEECQTIIGIGGGATTKFVDREENRIKAVFHPKDLITYLRDIDLYIEKREKLFRGE